jgi:hypothetical protein
LRGLSLSLALAEGRDKGLTLGKEGSMTVFIVRQAIQKVSTANGPHYLSLKAGEYIDYSKAKREAKKLSKSSSLPVMVIKKETQTMAAFKKGKALDV